MALLLLALASGGAFVAGQAVHRDRLWGGAEFAPNETEALGPYSNAPHELIASIIRRDASLPMNRSTPPDVAARAVRDWIYRTSSIGSGSMSSASAPDIYAALGTESGEQLCWGLSTAYAWALNMIGIPARRVQMATEDFLNGRDRFDTHVTVEVDFGSGWVVSDPTFNAEFECSNAPGKRIGVQELRACLDQGESIVPVQVGTIKPNRTVAGYYVPFPDLLAAYTISGSPDIEYPRQGWVDSAIALYE